MLSSSSSSSLNPLAQTHTINYQICVKRRKILVFVVLSCTNNSEHRTKVMSLSREREWKRRKKNRAETGWMNEMLLKCRRCWYCRINGNGVHWFYVYLPNVPIGIRDSRACCWNAIHSISTHSLFIRSLLFAFSLLLTRSLPIPLDIFRPYIFRVYNSILDVANAWCWCEYVCFQ